MFGRRRRELEAENLALLKKCATRAIENRVAWRRLRELQDFNSCPTCAKKHTKVCTFLPGPDEPVRINCPHYTRAVVSE